MKDEFIGVKGKLDGIGNMVNEVNKDVINVREGVAKNMETMANSYQKTFGTMTESYSSFLGNVVKIGDKGGTLVSGGLTGLLGFNADSLTNLSVDEKKSALEKLKEIQIRLR